MNALENIERMGSFNFSCIACRVQWIVAKNLYVKFNVILRIFLDSQIINKHFDSAEMNAWILRAANNK